MWNKLEKQLTAIHGIGPWTANYVLNALLCFPSAFPIDDVGLHNAIKYIITGSSKPTKTKSGNKRFCGKLDELGVLRNFFICGEHYT